MKDPCVYILANRQFGTLYIGVTSDLYGRMGEHTQALHEGFTKRYSVKRLVYYTYFSCMDDAIMREKQLKAWQRGKENPAHPFSQPGVAQPLRSENW